MRAGAGNRVLISVGGNGTACPGGFSKLVFNNGATRPGWEADDA